MCGLCSAEREKEKEKEKEDEDTKAATTPKPKPDDTKAATPKRHGACSHSLPHTNVTTPV